MDTTQLLYLAGAFVLGLLVAWFAGRSGPKRALEECEANAQTLQRTLDERTRAHARLEAQVKERAAEIERLSGEGGKLSTALKGSEEAAAQAAAQAAEQIAQLQSEREQAQADWLFLTAELNQAREAYAGERTRLAELHDQMEAQRAEYEARLAEAASQLQEAREAAQAAQAAHAEAAEQAGTALAVPDRSQEVTRLTTQVQALQTELEAVRANAARLAGQVALRPQLSAAEVEQYAALAGDPQQVIAALHERDQAVADARAEADYLRRTVGMLTGMGAELANELERRRREQQVLAYQVAGLNAAVRESETRQLEEKRTASTGLTGLTGLSEAPAGTIEAESRDLPVSTRPDNALESDDRGVEIPGVRQQAPAGTIEAESHDLPVSTRPDNALESDDHGEEVRGTKQQAPTGTIEAESHDLPVSTRPDNALEAEGGEGGEENAAATAAALALDLREQLDTRTQELEELRTQSAPLQANLDELQAEIEALNAAKADLEAQIEGRDGELTELREKLASLQAEAESAAAAKTGLEEKLHLRGAAWSSLLARVAALNADLDAALAADPAHADESEPSADAEEPPAEELAALAAAAPAAHGVPEGVRAADAAMSLGAAGAESSADDDTTQGQAVLDKLAAGVAAAVALFGRKNTRLADLESQVQSLAGDKDQLEAALAANADIEAQLEARDGELTGLQNRLGELEAELSGLAEAKAALESTLTAKDQALVAAQHQVEQLQSGLSQRSVRFDALSMHASSLEAEMEIAKLRRGELEEQVRSVAASLLALRPAAPSEEAPAEEQTGEAGEAGENGEAVTPSPAHRERSDTPSSVEQLAAAAAAITELVRGQERSLAEAQEQLRSLQEQVQGHVSDRQSLAAELESRGATLAEFETRLQSLHGEYSGLQGERGSLEATLQSLNDQLNAYLAEYGEADEDYPAESAAQPAAEGEPAPAGEGENENASETESVTVSAAASPAHPITAIGLLLKRRKDALDGANARIAELEDEISALTSAKSELDTQAEQGAQAVADLTAQLEAAQAEAAARTADIEALQQQVSELTAAKEEWEAQAPQREQALADLTAQLEAAQAEAAARTADVEALQQQVSDLTAAKSELETQVGEQGQTLAELQTQLEAAQTALAAAQAEAAERNTELETLRNQMGALQAEAAATEQERARLEAQWRSLNDDLAQFGAALDADDDQAVGSLAGALAQRMGGAAPAEASAERSVDLPLVKTAGAVALTAVAAKKLAALRATRDELASLQQQYAAALDAQAGLQAQLQSANAELEQTKTQLAAVEEQLAEAKAELAQEIQEYNAKLAQAQADHAAELQALNDKLSKAQADHLEELQVLDAKTAELQKEYNEAEAARLRLEGALASLNQELAELSAAVQSDDVDGLQQFVQKLGPTVPLTSTAGAEGGAEGGEPAEGTAEESTGAAAVKPLAVAGIAAALQRNREALREAAARAAAMQAQMEELSADREAAKALLADRDQALLSVESKLTELTVQVEKQVSDFKAAARAAAEARGVEVQTTTALQDFAELKHIGVTFEQRLYRAGVGTFWEAAHLTDEDYALILRLSEMQQLAIDLNETRQDALRMAEETNTVGVLSVGDPPDDFESIPGIGKVFEQRLYSAGIRTWWDLANASEEQLAGICRARKPLVPDYASWIRQARIYLEVKGK